MSAETKPEPYKPPAGDPKPDVTPARAVDLARQPQKAAQPPPAPPLHGPWPNVSVFGHRWTGPSRPAGPVTVAAIVVAALITAISVPLDRVGFGWLVAALAGTAALTVARLVPVRTGGTSTVPRSKLTYSYHDLEPARFGWAAATVALIGVGTLRSAAWLVILCLLTALLTGALAVAGGRSVRAMLLATLIAFLAPFRALEWVGRGFGAIRTSKAGAKDGTRIVATIAVSVALLVVFGTLFASADAAFADMLAKAVPDLNGASVARWIFLIVVTVAILGGAAFLRIAPPNLSGLDGPSPRRVSRLEWAIPLTLLVILFAMFVAVQLTVLFGGSSYVMDTDGLTYADHARGGFWQLLVVTGLTLLVLAGAARWAPRASRSDRTLIRVVLGALAGLTLVVVISALYRMNVYADTYGLTRLRLLVAACELWLGVVFLMVLIAGIRLRAAWLARAVVGAGVVALLGLVAVNPDGLIADRNVVRFEQTGRLDGQYLADLSPDAVPGLERLPQPERDCVLSRIARPLLVDEQDWQGWSYGRAHARELFEANLPEVATNCPGFYDNW